MKKFLQGENLEVILLLIGVILAYNLHSLFAEVENRRVAFMTGVTLFGTPTLLLYLYYKKIRNIFSRTIILALILLTLKEFLGGFVYLMGIKEGMSMVSNFTYNMSFWGQVIFMAAVLVVSYFRASRLDVKLYNSFTSIGSMRRNFCEYNDSKGNSNTEKSAKKNQEEVG